MTFAALLQATPDPMQAALACAAGGVVAAHANADPTFTPFEIKDIPYTAEFGTLPWSLPDMDTLTRLALTDETLLADLWWRVFAPMGQDLPFRLMIDAKDIGADAETFSIVCNALGGLDPYAGHGLGAICLALPNACAPHDWKWPYDMAVPAVLRPQLVENPLYMVGEDLVQIVAPKSASADITLRKQGPMAVDYCGFTILLADTASAPLTAAMRDASIIASTIRRPVAVVDAGEVSLDILIDNFLRECSHDKSPDFAITWAAQRSLISQPVLIVTPGEGYGAEMELARLHNRFAEMLPDLAPLAPMSPLPPVPPGTFDVFPDWPTPRNVGGLRAMLQRMSTHPEGFFHNESDGSSGVDGVRSLVEDLQDDLRPQSPPEGGFIARDRGGDAFSDVFSGNFVDHDITAEPESLAPSSPPFRARQNSAARSKPSRGGGVRWSHFPDDAPAAPRASVEAPPQPTSRGQEEAFWPEDSPAEMVEDSAPAAATAAAVEEDRFLDLMLYDGALYADQEAGPQLATDVSLKPYSDYTLDVAIRLHRTGIASDQPAPAVLNPRQDKAPQDVWVRVVAPADGMFTLGQSLQKITWPYNTDSTTARVHLRTGDTRMGQVGQFEVRILSDTLDLLEVVTVDGLRIGAASAITVTRPLGRPAALDPETTGLPRSLNLHITSMGNGFGLDAVWRNDAGDVMGLPLDRTILLDDLSALNASVRSYWAKKALGVLEKRDGLSVGGQNRILRDTARMGKRAWRVLFGDDDNCAAGQVGAMIQALDQSPDQVIQISYGTGSEGFVFPWAILRAPTPRDVPPTWEDFWGLRHVVEQVMKPPRPDGLDVAPIKVVTIQDPNFEQSAPHFAALKKIATDHGVDLGASLDSVDDVLDALEDPKPAHLFYFFCHGYAPDPSLLPRPMQEALSKANEPWAIGVGDRPDEAAISFGGGRLTEDDLASLDDFGQRRPVFFLNMCQSVEAAPGRSDGLLRRLINREAAAVIGTECEMTAAFASRFAETVLSSLWDGCGLGRAVLEARRHFVASGNPLGLAYSSYGRADIQLATTIPLPPTGDANEH